MPIRRRRSAAVLEKTLAVIFMALLLLAGLPSRAQAANDLPGIRALLRSYYVDPVSAEVLQAPTIDQTLSRLGDPYTVYFTPSDFQKFEDSLKNQYSGLGVQMKIVPKGVEVESVLAGSPAEGAGLRPGDIITRADGRPLGGLSANQASGLLKGPSGTPVSVVVLRGSTFLFLKITRQVLTQPEVSSELLAGHIGCLKINVFGSDIPQEFGKQAAALQQKGADAWILDLRDDPGGYLDAAVELAGYFIPGQTVVQIHDRSGSVTQLTAPAQDFKVQGSVLVLTNENTASAAETLSAALRDQGAAVLLGSKTFGKGSVQELFKFQDGGALKMTIAHFYSPHGTKINHVGVTPDLEVNPEYAQEEAALLLTGKQGAAAGNLVRITDGSLSYTVPLEQALTAANWKAWQDLVTSLAGKAQFWAGSSAGETLVSDTMAAKLFPLSYPGYQDGGSVQNPPLNKAYDLTFPETVLANQVTNADIQLIDLTSGERIPLYFQQNGPKIIKVLPKGGLDSGRTYWLVVNPTLRDSTGHPIGAGSVLVIHTY